MTRPEQTTEDVASSGTGSTTDHSPRCGDANEPIDKRAAAAILGRLCPT